MPSPRGSQRERGSPEEGERPSSLDGVSFIRIIRFLRVSEADRPGGSLHLCGRRRKRKKRTRADPCRSCSSHSSLFALAISPRSAGRVRSYALRKRLSKRTNVHRSIRLGSHSSPFSHAGGGRLAHLSLKSREKSDESEARALDHTRGRAVSLTRNCCIEHLAGLEVEEAEAELVRALAQTAKGAGAMELFVGERAGVAIGEATVVGAEGGRCATEAHGTAAQDGHGAVGRGRGLGAEESAARDLVVRGEGEPGGEMLLAAPAAHVGAD